MSGDEFALIKQLCRQIPVPKADSSDIGPGDDAAIINVPADSQLVISTDTLNADVHFYADADPYTIGHKALAVNLSDLAAMGADAHWVTLNLSLPGDWSNPGSWLEPFSAGFGRLAREHSVELLGGDTTSGPLAITVTAMGLVPKAQAVLRNGAQPGELIVVSGHLGAAAGALALLQNGQTPPPGWQKCLQQPTPRLALGRALRSVATSMIDISDGLMADLQHVLTQSGCGARIQLSALPLLASLTKHPLFDWCWPLAGGDDYELCFTVAASDQAMLESISQAMQVPLNVIGQTTDDDQLMCLDENGDSLSLEHMGWNHFKR